MRVLLERAKEDNLPIRQLGTWDWQIDVRSVPQGAYATVIKLRLDGALETNLTQGLYPRWRIHSGLMMVLSRAMACDTIMENVVMMALPAGLLQVRLFNGHFVPRKRYRFTVE